MQVECRGQHFAVEVPAGVAPGDTFTTTLTGGLHQYLCLVSKPRMRAVNVFALHTCVLHIPSTCAGAFAFHLCLSMCLTHALYMSAVRQQAPLGGVVAAEQDRVTLTAEEVQQRVARLQTPLVKQADALFRKNLTLQRKKCEASTPPPMSMSLAVTSRG